MIIIFQVVGLHIPSCLAFQEPIQIFLASYKDKLPALNLLYCTYLMVKTITYIHASHTLQHNIEELKI